MKNNSDLTIRVAKPTDALAIVNLLQDSATESDNMLFSGDIFDVTVKEEEKIINLFTQNKNAAMLVAIIDDKIIGIGTIDGQRYKHVIHNCEVALTIKKSYWGQKIGSMLMQELLKTAKKMGKTNLTLSVKADNEAALKLYAKFGFESVGLYKNYFYINQEYFDLQILQLIV